MDGEVYFLLRRQYSDPEAFEAVHQNGGSHQRAWEHHADIDGKTMKTGWWFQTLLFSRIYIYIYIYRRTET